MTRHITKLAYKAEQKAFSRAAAVTTLSGSYLSLVERGDIVWVFSVIEGEALLLTRFPVGSARLGGGPGQAILEIDPVASPSAARSLPLKPAGLVLEYESPTSKLFGSSFTESGGVLALGTPRGIRSGLVLTDQSAKRLESLWQGAGGATPSASNLELPAVRKADRPEATQKGDLQGTLTSTPLTIFSWGYEGWGSSLKQLFQSTEAAERSRGFEPPVFVDIRARRSVRAPGFRDSTFEKAIPKGRYHWMNGLGNARLGTGGIEIKRPQDAERLLDMAIAEARNGRRIIFFCSCGSPETCHRNQVRELLLNEARQRKLALQVAEWPGGELEARHVHALTVSPADYTRITSGGQRIPIEEQLALGVFAALPWCSFIEITDGDRRATVSVGPSKFSGHKWFIEPLFPVDDGDEIKDLLKAAEEARMNFNFRTFSTSE